MLHSHLRKVFMTATLRSTGHSYDLCSCGRLKRTDANQCVACYAAAKHASQTLKKRPDKYDTCPGCGGLKDKRAKTCANCRSKTEFPKQTYRYKGHPRLGDVTFDPNSVDPLWAAWFAGLFTGEGYIGLSGATSNPKAFPRPVVAINMRMDEVEILEEIASVLGGGVGTYIQTKHCDQCRWSLAGQTRVRNILLLLVTHGRVGRKLKEAQLVLEYLEWRQGIGAQPGEEARAVAQSYVERLALLKRYGVGKVQD